MRSFSKRSTSHQRPSMYLAFPPTTQTSSLTFLPWTQISFVLRLIFKDGPLRRSRLPPRWSLCSSNQIQRDGPTERRFLSRWSRPWRALESLRSNVAVRPLRLVWTEPKPMRSDTIMTGGYFGYGTRVRRAVVLPALQQRTRMVVVSSRRRRLQQVPPHRPLNAKSDATWTTGRRLWTSLSTPLHNRSLVSADTVSRPVEAGYGSQSLTTPCWQVMNVCTLSSGAAHQASQRTKVSSWSTAPRSTSTWRSCRNGR